MHCVNFFRWGIIVRTLQYLPTRAPQYENNEKKIYFSKLFQYMNVKETMSLAMFVKI